MARTGSRSAVGPFWSKSLLQLWGRGEGVWGWSGPLGDRVLGRTWGLEEGKPPAVMCR